MGELDEALAGLLEGFDLVRGWGCHFFLSSFPSFLLYLIFAFWMSLWVKG